MYIYIHVHIYKYIYIYIESVIYLIDEFMIDRLKREFQYKRVFTKSS